MIQTADQIVHDYYRDDPDDDPGSRALSLGYPPALAKACCDTPYDYALALHDGTVIRFAGATPIDAEWVTLDTDEDYGPSGLPHPCPRGVDVRVSEIVWVADAPEGS